MYNSDLKVNKLGFLNNHEFLIKNAITNNKNSKVKNKENIYLSGIYQFNSNIPLIKDGNSYQEILKPKISFRLAPNHTVNQSDESDRLNLSNVYTIDRSTNNLGVEGGISATYGFNYAITNKTKKNQFLNFELANNLRIKENDDLSKTNQIGQKTSNILSNIEFKANNFFSMGYSSLLKNNLKDINYENLKTKFELNKFQTLFEYSNENDNIEKKTYLTNISNLDINRSNSLKFSTKINKKNNITEFYNLMYQYRNDCLKAAVEYKKDFYSDRQIESKENLFFKLTFIPLGETSSPNLKK
jgi:LPS-assembly protein